MPSLKELNDTLEVKRGELAGLFEKAKTGQVDPETNSPVFDLQKAGIAPDEIKKRTTELGELGEALRAAQEIDEAYKANQAAIRQQAQPNRKFDFAGGDPTEDQKRAAQSMKSVGQLIAEDQTYKRVLDSGTKTPFNMKIDRSMKSAVAQAAEMKTITESTGYAPYPTLQPYIIYTPLRRLVVADLIPQDDTDQAVITYMEETTFTNNAAAVSEGAAKPASDLGLTRRTLNPTKIATIFKVTDEQLRDVRQFRSYIDNRGTYMVQFEEERELLSGSGTPPEMTGFLNKSGINTQAMSTDDIFTAHYKILTKIRSVGYADPSGYVFNPNDWQIARTAKATTGQFILGPPDQAGPDTLWGLPVVQTVAMTAGTSLSGDFRMYSHIDRLWGLTVEVGYDGSDFSLNLSTVRIEERLFLEIYRALAFGTVTGIS